jgi:hypothetical protein
MQIYSTNRSRLVLLVTVIFLTTQFPSLRAIAKYFPAPYLTGPLFLLLALLGIVLTLNPPKVLRGFLQGVWPTAIIAISMTVASFVIYPYAEALKLQGRGSDADDALIIAGQALWRFENPYIQETYLGNPIAPGVGWVLLASPFSLTGFYSAFLPATLGIAIWSLRASRHSWARINQLILLLASSLCVWELIAEGNDYLPFALLTLSAFLGLKSTTATRGKIILLTALIGALATFRLPFLLLPALLGFCLLSSFPRRAMIVASFATVLAVLLHGAFMIITPAGYSPFHLLRAKAGNAFSTAGFFVAILLCVILALVMIVTWRRWPPLTHLGAGLAVPWTIVSLADSGLPGSVADWGGAGYFMMWLPFVILSFCR